MINKLRKRLSSVTRRFLIICKDQNRKSFYRIFKEFIIATIDTKSIATHYFSSFLYKYDNQNYLDHISHKEGRFLQRELCDSDTFTIQGNKLFFHLFFANTNLPLPDLIAYNIREKIIVKCDNIWKSFEVDTPLQFAETLRIILKNSKHGQIFIKPSTGSEGSGIIKLSTQSDEDLKELSNSIFNNIVAHSYLFQAAVRQHNDLDRINNTTLNTIRIDTFKAYGKNPEIISAYMRIGRRSSFVDNLAAGGYRVGIDLENGTLKKYATTKIEKGNDPQTHHADSRVQFNGLKIPFFPDVKKLAIDATNYLPQSLIGWDIGVSEKGPVIIECNSVYYDMVGADIAYGGYKKNPRYQKVWNYVKSGMHRRWKGM
jgi:hypothetical protein